MLYLLLFSILLSSFSVIYSKNIIQSVLFLILVFFLACLLCLFLGCDFIGLIILIVYIGAIAVLFLFVVMMLNIRILELVSIFSVYFILGLFIIFMFLSIILFLYSDTYNWNDISILNSSNLDLVTLNNVKILAIGELLFNELPFLFLGATLLLFIAMIGVFILILNKKESPTIVHMKLCKNFNWKF